MKDLRISGSNRNSVIELGCVWAQILRRESTFDGIGTQYDIWAQASCDINQCFTRQVHIGTIHARSAAGPRGGNRRVFDAYSFTGRTAWYDTRE